MSRVLEPQGSMIRTPVGVDSVHWANAVTLGDASDLEANNSLEPPAVVSESGIFLFAVIQNRSSRGQETRSNGRQQVACDGKESRHTSRHARTIPQLVSIASLMRPSPVC